MRWADRLVDRTLDVVFGPQGLSWEYVGAQRLRNQRRIRANPDAYGAAAEPVGAGGGDVVDDPFDDDPFDDEPDDDEPDDEGPPF
jgi:hypothetical protein